MLLLVYVREAILEQTVNKGLVSKLGTCPQIGEVVGSVGHALSTRGDDDVGIASDDGLGTNDESLDRGCADLVDGCGDGGFGETSTNCALAGRVLAEAV